MFGCLSDAASSISRSKHGVEAEARSVEGCGQVRLAEPVVGVTDGGGLDLQVSREDLTLSSTPDDEARPEMRQAEAARSDAIQVDSFSLAEYARGAAREAESAGLHGPVAPVPEPAEAPRG